MGGTVYDREKPIQQTEFGNAQHMGYLNEFGIGWAIRVIKIISLIAIVQMLLISLIVILEKWLGQLTLWFFAVVRFLGTPARMNSESRILGSELFKRRSDNIERTINISDLGEEKFKS